jgi:hypothetical protein
MSNEEKTNKAPIDIIQEARRAAADHLKIPIEDVTLNVTSFDPLLLCSGRFEWGGLHSKFGYGADTHEGAAMHALIALGKHGAVE